MGIFYKQVGDYLLPNLVLSDPPDAPPIGRYGRMRKEFLKTHRSITYSRLLLTERLFPHLREVDQCAHYRLDRLMSDIAALNQPPDKAADGLVWAAHMTEVRSTAEKMMLDEVVYA